MDVLIKTAARLTEYRSFYLKRANLRIHRHQDLAREMLRAVRIEGAFRLRLSLRIIVMSVRLLVDHQIDAINLGTTHLLLLRHPLRLPQLWLR